MLKKRLDEISEDLVRIRKDNENLKNEKEIMDQRLCFYRRYIKIIL